MNNIKNLAHTALFIGAAFSLSFQRVFGAFTCPAGTKEVPGTGVCVAKDTGLSEVGVTRILTVALSWLAFTFGSIAIIILVVCGFQYLLSAGDDTQAENAKRCMKWAVTGIIVVGLSWTIVRTLGWLLFGLPPLW